MLLGSCIAVAVAVAGSCNSNWIPSLGTSSIRHGCCPKEQKKKKKRQEEVLASMWRNYNPQTLLVGMKNGQLF